jgi:hypothetical protein
MQRREFIVALGSAATAWPLAARAQQPAMPVIGYLATGSPDVFASRLAALRQGLGEHGYVEGRNVAIEYRWASGHYDQMKTFATELVARRVDVIVSVGPPSLRAAVAATSTSLIGRLGSSAFRLSTTAVSMPLAGSCFSSESAPRPFHHGIRGRGGTIYSAALPSDVRQVQADMRTHLIHRPARDIIPPLGGARVSSYRI